MGKKKGGNPGSHYWEPGGGEIWGTREVVETWCPFSDAVSHGVGVDVERGGRSGVAESFLDGKDVVAIG